MSNSTNPNVDHYVQLQVGDLEHHEFSLTIRNVTRVVNLSLVAIGIFLYYNGVTLSK